MKYLKGKVVAESIKGRVAEKVRGLTASEITPSLHVIQVGKDPASSIYVKSKAQTCEELGMKSVVHAFPDSMEQEALIERIRVLNDDPEVDGILVQLPLPPHMDEFTVTSRVDPAKDVDGFHPVNVGLLTLGKGFLLPCTPAGIMEMLDYYEIPIDGKRAVVIGRSTIVGKPMAFMLLKRNATVTICHSKTRDLRSVAGEADILVAAIGKPGIVDETFVKEGAIVVDVGVNKITDPNLVERFFSTNEKKRSFFEKRGYVLIGDVDGERVKTKAGALTPVPGGVGPLTIAMLMQNTLTACSRRRGKG